MLTGLTSALKGINGGYEINRLVGFFGASAYIIGAHIFVAYEVFWLGKDFDLTAYCLAFPGGLAGLGLGTGAAVAIKDRNVAASRVVEATGSKPADPPAPAPKPQPELAAAIEPEPSPVAPPPPPMVEEANL